MSANDAGLASGLFNTAQQVGGSLGLAILATLAASQTTSVLHGVPGHATSAATVAARVSGYHVAFAAAAVMLAAGALIMLFVLRPRRRAGSGPGGLPGRGRSVGAGVAEWMRWRPRRGTCVPTQSATARRLLDAATALFRERGLDVGVAEIAAAAGVGRGTLFRNFPSKEDLIAAIVSRADGRGGGARAGAARGRRPG